MEVNNPEVSETGTAMNWRLDEQTVMSVELELDNFEVVETGTVMKCMLLVCQDMN